MKRLTKLYISRTQLSLRQCFKLLVRKRFCFLQFRLVNGDSQKYDRRDTGLTNGTDKVFPIWSRVFGSNNHTQHVIVPVLPIGSCLQPISDHWEVRTQSVSCNPEMTQIAHAPSCFGLRDLSLSLVCSSDIESEPPIVC